jgi:excisionase family DNA binding protein
MLTKEVAMLHTVDEAANRLKLSVHTVRVAIRRGTIPAVRLGRVVRIAAETLDALERVGHPSLTKPRGVDR